MTSDIQKQNQLKKNGVLPSHVAIIMDGNGRWAKQKGKLRVFGHKEGVNTVRDITEACTELGIKYLTLYTFSTENWNRPQYEVSAIMKLLIETTHKELMTIVKNNMQFNVIGDMSKLPIEAQKVLMDCKEQTKKNTGTMLTLALNYGSRDEILQAAKQIAEAVKQGTLSSEDITEERFHSYFYTTNMPSPDLLIRTGGEYRISNFLLWQIAYTELFFTEEFWPDFNRSHLYAIIEEYQNRERRFGKISEQMEKTKAE